MSKSVLVMNMPESCRSCYLRGFTLDLQYCRVKKKDIKDTSVKPDWCPLKPLPEKNKAPKVASGYELGYEDGWNKCLDEITGGEGDGEINRGL